MQGGRVHVVTPNLEFAEAGFGPADSNLFDYGGHDFMVRLGNNQIPGRPDSPVR